MSTPPSPIEPQGLLDGLRWGSILLGALVDNVLTILGFGLLTAALASEEAFSEDPAAAERAYEELAASPEFLVLGLLVGVTATVYGAFVGARRAGVSPVRHGGWVAVCSAALSLIPYLLASQPPTSSPPLWYEALGWLLLLPSGLAGGYLAGRVLRLPPEGDAA